MEILEMKNTVAEIQKSNWVSLTAKWGEEEYRRVIEDKAIEITKSYKEKTD